MKARPRCVRRCPGCDGRWGGCAEYVPERRRLGLVLALLCMGLAAWGIVRLAAREPMSRAAYERRAAGNVWPDEINEMTGKDYGEDPERPGKVEACEVLRAWLAWVETFQYRKAFR